ncbi:MAG: hypothetical protein U1F71_07565 [Verrucomicrobiaceae bacterium]
MKQPEPKTRHIHAIVCSMLFVLSSGCSTSTNLGLLIPSHPNSEKTDGEVTIAGYARHEDHQTTYTEKSATGYAVPAALVAGWVASMAIDAVKAELEREAEKYEHQVSARALLTYKELGARGTLLCVRWTDQPKKSLRAKTHANAQVETHDDSTALLHEIAGKLFNGRDQADLTSELERLRPAGKVPQWVLALPVRKHELSIYKASQPKLWVASVGAKVVAFNPRQPVGYLGAAFFKTSSQARMDIQMTARGAEFEVIDQGGGALKTSWKTLEPSSTLVSGATVDLNKPGQVYSAGGRAGSWLPIPVIGITKDSIKNGDGDKPYTLKKEMVGFLDISFAVTETDKSNTKKKITQAADYVGKNKASWVDWVKKQVGGS